MDLVKICKVWDTAAMPDEEEKSMEFIRRCLREGLISDDLSSWKGLHSLYNVLNRELPISFWKKARLGVLLAAHRDAKNGNKELLIKYKAIGDEIDHTWFDNSLSKEEDFVAGIIVSSSGVGQDELGYYRQDEHGKWRQAAGIGDDGRIIFLGGRAQGK